MVDKFGRSAHKRTENISVEGASLSYINDNFIRNNGSGQMTGVLNMGGNKISNVHDPVDNQDVATKQYVDSNMSENSHNSDIDMNRYRIQNLRMMPEDNSEAVSKYYVDSKISEVKPVIAIWAVEKNELASGRSEWSFGHGITHRNGGYTMPCPGRLIRMSLRSCGSTGLVTVALTVNGDNNDDYYNVTQLPNRNSGTRTFETPLQLDEGSVINFVSKTTNPNATASYVTALIELYL